MELSELLGEAYHEGMSLEEVNTALAGIESPFAERDRYKQALSKSNTEAAGYRKQLKSAQEASKNGNAEYEELNKNFKAIQKELNIEKKTKSLMKSGYSEDLANEASAALEDGDFNKFMEIQAKFLAERDKVAQISAIKNTPRPAVGSTGKEANIVDYDALIAGTNNYGMKAYYQRLKQEQENNHTLTQK